MRGSVGCVGHERDHRAPTDLGQGKSPFSFCGNGFILISGSPGIVRRLKPKQLKPLCCECQRFLCLNVQLDMILHKDHRDVTSGLVPSFLPAV